MHPSKKKTHVKFTSYEMARHLSHLSCSLELHDFVILFRPGNFFFGGEWLTDKRRLSEIVNK